MSSDSDILAVFHRLVESNDSAFDAAKDLDPYLCDVKLYPFAPLLELGSGVGEILEKKPEVAVEIVPRIASSTVDGTRALACVVIGRLARYAPAEWMSLAHHLASDDSWEVREYVAHIFDTHGHVEGLAAFHLDYCFEVLSQWVRDSDYHVRRVTTSALLGYFLRCPEIGERLLELLEPLLSDSSDYVRRNMVFALCTIGKKRPELVFSLLENHLGDNLGTTRDILRQTLDHRWTHGHEARRDSILKRLSDSNKKS